MLKRTLIASLFLGCLCAKQPAVAASIYSVTGLGFLPGGTSSTATSIDNQGEVGGYTTFADASTEASLWTIGGLQGLGGTNSKAFGVNSGNVVGIDGAQAFRWTSGPGKVLLDPSNAGQANGVNSTGEAVGSRNLGLGPNHQLLTWSPSNTLNNPFSVAHLTGAAINSLGQVTGILNGTSGYYYDGISASFLGLGSLRTTSLSDNRIAAGSLSSVATLENIDSSSLTTIGTLSGDAISNALGINSLGTQIVGISQGHGGFLYDIGTANLQSLTSLLDPAFNGWSILSATSINDNGQIVGVGVFNGVQQAVLLTPIPEPSSIVLGGLALVGLVAFSIRRKAFLQSGRLNRSS